MKGEKIMDYMTYREAAVFKITLLERWIGRDERTLRLSDYEVYAMGANRAAIRQGIAEAV